jgi:hypothetical protein
LSSVCAGEVNCHTEYSYAVPIHLKDDSKSKELHGSQQQPTNLLLSYSHRLHPLIRKRKATPKNSSKQVIKKGERFKKERTERGSIKP